MDVTFLQSSDGSFVSDPLHFGGPTLDYHSALIDLARRAHSPVYVCVAYISEFAFDNFFDRIDPGLDVYVVCDTHSLSTDTQGILDYAHRRGKMKVMHCDRVHAKFIYTLGSLITGSANLSQSALDNQGCFAHFEQGVLLRTSCSSILSGEGELEGAHDYIGIDLSIFEVSQEISLVV